MSQESGVEDPVTEGWRKYLTTGEPPDSSQSTWFNFQNLRRLFGLLPKDPRCRVCKAPFEGIGGGLVRLTMGRTRSKMNPNLCNVCEQYSNVHQGGAEIELSMLFADIRGSTTLAEGMNSTEFSQLINRFYQEVTHVLIHRNALIEKMIGDEVTGLFVPGFAGQEHARVAVEAALEILKATGHEDPSGPWVPLGIGVHTGVAFVGAVGSSDGLTDISVLGDAANTAARIGSQAAIGEVIISEQSYRAAFGDDAGDGVESRRLQLKGRSEAVDVRVLRVSPPVSTKTQS